ncbi:dnaJ homolog subfamily C member 21 [Lepeophtheirus salmonis]|uniref:DnaJ homolog subfamily C member 21like [Apis florea] n=1 Tax=Lepeophtheirus salmonis TaxID=72036 RepID=A0A0K2V5T7_LEPSM|nr:dnaJ homolog subfamily C member 21-like [Lepeophtheirus salmonis]
MESKGAQKSEKEESSLEQVENGLTAIHLALNSLPITKLESGGGCLSRRSSNNSSISSPGRRNSGEINLLEPLLFTTEIHHESDEDFCDYYRKIFDRIAYEELAYSDDGTPRRRNSLIPFLDDAIWSCDLNLDDAKFPTFGHANSPVEIWKIFYDFYENFETKVNFHWLWKHDLSEATTVPAWKKIERSNRPVVDRARKERNEHVKSLVAFVKSKDKRTNTPINLKKQLRRGSLLKALK